MTNIELGDVSQQIYEPGNLVLCDSASLVRIACKRVADSSLVIEVPDDPAHAMRPGRAQMSEFRFHMHCIRNKVAPFVEAHHLGREVHHQGCPNPARLVTLRQLAGRKQNYRPHKSVPWGVGAKT